MAIDIHSHLFVREFHHESWWDGLAHFLPSSVPGTAASEEVAQEFKNTVLPQWWDPGGAGHIRRMDEAGIEKSVLLAVDLGLVLGEAEITIEQQNKHVSQVVEKHPDRLVWFCGVDPRRDGVVELFERCVTEWGARGLKLYPIAGFLPADRASYPLYERASAWKVPVLFHMGVSGGPPFKNEGHAHVSTLLRVLVDFPDLTVIVAHLGMGFWQDLIALGKVRENVMCDFCAWQDVIKEDYDTFCYVLRQVLDQFGKDRVMFGTDAPALEHKMTTKEFVNIIGDLPDKAPSPTRFTEEEVSAILDSNARRLLDSIPQISVQGVQPKI